MHVKSGLILSSPINAPFVPFRTVAPGIVVIRNGANELDIIKFTFGHCFLVSKIQVTTFGLPNLSTVSANINIQNGLALNCCSSNMLQDGAQHGSYEWSCT